MVAFMIVPYHISNIGETTMTNMTRRIEKTTKRNRLDWEEAADMQAKKRKGEARKAQRQTKRQNWEEQADA